MYNILIDLFQDIRCKYENDTGHIINKHFTNNTNHYYSDIIKHIHTFIFDNSIKMELMRFIYTTIDISNQKKIVFNLKKKKRRKNKVILSLIYDNCMFNDINVMEDDNTISFYINFDYIKKIMFIESHYEYLKISLDNLKINKFRIISEYNTTYIKIIDIEIDIF